MEVTLRFLDFILKDEGIPFGKGDRSGLFLKITLATALRTIWVVGVKADARRPDTIINPGKMVAAWSRRHYLWDGVNGQIFYIL